MINISIWIHYTNYTIIHYNNIITLYHSWYDIYHYTINHYESLEYKIIGT